MQYTPNPDRDSGRLREGFVSSSKKMAYVTVHGKKPAPPERRSSVLCKYKPETRQLALSALIGIRDDREFVFSRSLPKPGRDILEARVPSTPPGGGAAVSVLEACTSLTTPPLLPWILLPAWNECTHGRDEVAWWTCVRAWHARKRMLFDARRFGRPSGKHASHVLDRFQVKKPRARRRDVPNMAHLGTTQR